MNSITIDTPVYSGKNIRNCWNYVLKNGENIDVFFNDIDIPRERLLDEDEWFNVEVIKKVYRNYRSCLNDYNMLLDNYDIGFESIIDSSWGATKVILQLLSPRNTYKLATKATKTLSKIDLMSCIHITNNIAYIKYRRHDLFKKELLDSSFTKATAGTLSAIPVIYGMPEAEVKEVVSCLDIYQLFHNDLFGYNLKLSEDVNSIYLNGRKVGRRITINQSTKIDPIIDKSLNNLDAVFWEKDIELQTKGGRNFFAAREGDYYNLPFSIFRVKWVNPKIIDRVKRLRISIFELLKAFFQSKNELIIKSQKMQNYSMELEKRVQERTSALKKEIKDRIKIEKRLEKSLSEKEVLLAEIHHRVKNNLQIISSLLDMTRYREKDPEANASLIGAKLKIQSMAQIHSQLYRTKEFSNIDIEKQVVEIFKSIDDMYHNNSKIRIITKSDGTKLPTKFAIPTVLVLNELLTNSYKHAFQPGAKGIIKVYAKQLPDNVIEIVYSDNGCGMSKDVNIENVDSLGLKLVRIIVRNQLEGQLKINVNKGTSFKITFSLNE